MSKIKSITARQILDSRGNPTIETTVYTTNSVGIASVPEGASKGKYEASELRDDGVAFGGLGVTKAVLIIEKKIAPLLIGFDCCKQKEIDEMMIKADGTTNKRKFGANAILSVSLACARAAANSLNKPLYKYLHGLSVTQKKISLPIPFFNVINGGKHADNNLSFQEFMIVPQLKSFSDNLRAGSEIYHTLKQELHKKYGFGATAVGDEGGFAPTLKNTEEALNLLIYTIKKAGYLNKVSLALDCAATSCYKNGVYQVDGKRVSKENLLLFYLKLIKKYPLISIEDPFEENDFVSFAKLRKKTKIQIVGDDLTVTNPLRIKKAIDLKSCSCLLLKVNQIGTLSEAMQAAHLAFAKGWSVMVSHRSAETQDSFIADLATGLGCGMIKAGAPCRGERIVKYNRLLAIEEELKKK